MSLFPTQEVTGCLPAVSSTVVEGAKLLQAIQESAAQHKPSLFHELCHTLITPLDPEDLFRLSGMMISTMDEIAASSESFRL